MKTQLLSIDGKKQKEIELPKVFSSKIREDIVKKVFETEKTQHPYGPDVNAGRKHSASGTMRHKRHAWKAHYGKGMSRIPRKIMWRRGTQFFWIGAEISSTRGGRRAHGPKPIGFMKFKKINKKEYLLALNSAIAATAQNELVKSRYARLDNKQVKDFPIVIDSKITGLKTKDLIKSINSVLGELNIIAEKTRNTRAGKGKSRNRKYKTSQGILIVTGDKEKIKTKNFDSLKVNEITVSDLYPLGRITIYTENAIKELNNMKVAGSVRNPQEVFK